MPTTRGLCWDGFFNARDLGGLPTRAGQTTRYGVFVRSADLRFVTETGWRAAHDYGIRTVIDLRNEDEVMAGPQWWRWPATSTAAQSTSPNPATTAHPDIDRAAIMLDDVGDVEFQEHVTRHGFNGSPLWFQAFLARKPDRCAAAITALAQAPSGGSLFHCGAGRDRTGLIALLLLALVDVEPEAIAADYTISTKALQPWCARLGVEDPGPMIRARLARQGTTLEKGIFDTLHRLNAKSYLLGAGVTHADIARIRTRLLGQTSSK